ncbi:MAG TPA: Fe(2+)-trafficking protein, partial [Rubrivivax sp.]|nr:Fe(2+)-trafficking protein [Rubrivivax sp.]
SAEAFELWKRHQTMLVNENRLSLADASARQYLAQQMEQFLFGGQADKVAGYVPPRA